MQLPMAIALLYAAFGQLPQDLFDSARIDGAGDLKILWKIVIPLTIPIFSTVAILNIISSWNEFIWPLLLVKDASLRTIPLGLFLADVEFDLRYKLGMWMATYAVSAIPMLLAFFILLKPFMKAMTEGALKE